MGSSHISKKINWSTKYCKYSSAKADSTLSKTKPSTIIPSQLAFAPQYGGASFARTTPRQAKQQYLHGHAFLTPLPAVRLGCPASSSMIRRKTTKTGLCNTVLPQMFQTILYDSSNGNCSRLSRLLCIARPRHWRGLRLHGRATPAE